MNSSTTAPETYASSLKKASEPPQAEKMLSELIKAGIHPGTRCFFWDKDGQIVRGFVGSSFRAVDGLYVLSINTDEPGPWGRSVDLPAAAVTISPN